MRGLVVAVVAAFTLATPPAARAAAGRPRIAVMELRAGQGLDPRSAGTLTTVLSADAARVGFDVISQSDIAAMLAFQKQRQMLGCADDGCLAELGGALGADFVLSGEAAVVGSRNHVSLVLVDSKRAAVVARSAGFSEAGADQLAIAALARFRALVKQVRPDLAAAAPAIESPDARRLHARRTAAWWTLGAGGVVLAGGAAVGLVARSQANDLAGAWQEPDYRARFDRQRRTARTADALLGAGLVTAGVGAWLYLTSDVPVIAVPVANQGVAGLVLAGRF
jgi:TolB-like protein